MKYTTHKKLALAGWLLAGCFAQALAGQEVPVGRVDVKLPNDGWQVHAIEDKGNSISGDGHTHQQDAEYKILVHRGADDLLDAVLMVRANSSGKGRFTGLMFSNAQCQGGNGLYAEGDEPGPSARSFRCLRVALPYATTGSKAVPVEVQDALSKLGWRLPPTLFAVSAVQYATSGAFAVVVAYMRPLAGAPADSNAQSVPGNLPVGVTASSVQWGRQLQQAVTDSVYSIGGKLTVPAMVFADDASGRPDLPARTQPATTPARTPVPESADRG